MFDKYEVKLTLIRDMLGTNPCDPQVMDTHIIDRQRKLIMENSKLNKEINKYLDAMDISDEKKNEEANRLVDNLEKTYGLDLSPENREEILKNGLESLKETMAELSLKGTTIFFWDKKADRPCIGDHMIYGFLKAAGEAICKTKSKGDRQRGTVLESISYTDSLINQHVRCESQFITFDRDVKRNEDGIPVYLQRSLRAMTAQGPRISLAKSEVVEAGGKLQFILKVMSGSPITQEVLEKLFSYGEISGLGQWRNSGKGQFAFEMMKR